MVYISLQKQRDRFKKPVPLIFFSVTHLFRSQFLEPFTADHAGDAEDDEGDAEELSHVKRHGILEVNLCLFGELNEETGGENQGEAQTEEKAGTNFF